MIETVGDGDFLFMVHSELTLDGGTVQDSGSLWYSEVEDGTATVAATGGTGVYAHKTGTVRGCDRRVRRPPRPLPHPRRHPKPLTSSSAQTRKEKTMPTYVIERNIPGAGSITDREWAEASTLSNQTIVEIGGFTWLHSYVTFDKVYCVYEADNEDLLREHGRRCDFPVDRVAEACRIIDPTTAGARV
ncbi:MAG TPA: DUF4242 domain-containing protein [Acidimicrobiales bacterium]|nr:DUF4242 domain-containing protein [Acidimicrobiales bacterium]